MSIKKVVFLLFISIFLCSSLFAMEKQVVMKIGEELDEFSILAEAIKRSKNSDKELKKSFFEVIEELQDKCRNYEKIIDQYKDDAESDFDTCESDVDDDYKNVEPQEVGFENIKKENKAIQTDISAFEGGESSPPNMCARFVAIEDAELKEYRKKMLCNPEEERLKKDREKLQMLLDGQRRREVEYRNSILKLKKQVKELQEREEAAKKERERKSYNYNYNRC